MSIIRGLLLAAASVAIAAPGNTQAVPVPPPAKDGEVVEGATPDRVAQIQSCQGHKFDSVVEIDPVRKRSTRVKLCANPGSSDADWVKTLQAAIVQIEQRAMPPAAREKLIGELQGEIAKFKVASSPVVVPKGFELSPGRGPAPLTAPSERFETSTLPPLTPKVAAKGGAVAKAAPPPPMRIRIKCLERGESGSGINCDFFTANTILAISAVEGLEQGGTLRFRRKGEARGEVTLASMQPGQLARVKLPRDLCRGVSHSRVEIELLGPKSNGAVAGRSGPYGLRC